MDCERCSSPGLGCELPPDASSIRQPFHRSCPGGGLFPRRLAPFDADGHGVLRNARSPPTALTPCNRHPYLHPVLPWGGRPAGSCPCHFAIPLQLTAASGGRHDSAPDPSGRRGHDCGDQRHLRHASDSALRQRLIGHSSHSGHRHGHDALGPSACASTVAPTRPTPSGWRMTLRRRRTSRKRVSDACRCL